ncbi:hypothetical protein KY284_021088 [Solanum tuberosum]|nr:hypothetical protein KY284_021088 [Solanum tuberosum]
MAGDDRVQDEPIMNENRVVPIQELTTITHCSYHHKINKLGIMDGSCNKKVYSENLWNHWEQVDAIVQSWLINFVSKNLLGGIMYASTARAVWQDLQERITKIAGSRTFNLHKEIATLTQGTNSVSIYFSKLKTLWEEFEALVPPSGCDCEKSKEFIIHLQKLKLFQFLMRVNDSYNQARSQILLMTPLPSINQASAMVVGDETQSIVSVTAGVLGPNPMAHSSNYEVSMYSRTGGGKKFTRYSHLYCEVCKIRGQNNGNCWKIVGYPIEFKYKKKKPYEGGSTFYNVIEKESPRNDVRHVKGTSKSQPGFTYGTNTNVHSQSQSAGSMDQIQSKLSNVDANHFTQEQYNHIVQLLTQHSPQVRNDLVSSTTANTAGIMADSMAMTDLFTGKVKEIGKEENGLYWLLSKDARRPISLAAQESNGVSNIKDVIFNETVFPFIKEKTSDHVFKDTHSTLDHSAQWSNIPIVKPTHQSKQCTSVEGKSRTTNDGTIEEDQHDGELRARLNEEPLHELRVGLNEEPLQGQPLTCNTSETIRPN